METTINILPEVSEKSDIVLLQLMKSKHEMGSTVKKDARNPFHKSNYASLGAHLDLSEEILFKHGLMMLQCPNLIKGEPILVVTIHHPESGQWIKSYLPLPNPKGDSQSIGASITYMRRYSINSMLGLNAEDDDGETASGRGQYSKKEKEETVKAASQSVNIKPQSPQPPKIPSTQVALLRSLEAKLTTEYKKKIYSWLETSYKISNLEDVTLDNFNKVLISLQNAVKLIDQEKLEMVNA